ncbi:MAG: deoxyguanosinetriphosphate triphosphohydrolase [Candidatus Omnitrophota bacterium]
MTEELSLLTRAQQEERERLHLAPYAARSGESLGRVYTEAEHPYRTCYQRDRDRIVHCAAFRRLEYKTQVFVNREGDHYRTRMTHSLEVGQISRTLGRLLGVNEDLCEAHALAHDLGHPPFGHSGERVLNELMAEHGGFEHNAQALRIVDRLEKRYPSFPGLNLTAETRRGILKTKSPYAGMGAGMAARNPIECQIVDIADEISYTSHDLDDGIESGLLRTEEMMRTALWREAWEAAEKQCPGLDAASQRFQTIIHIINVQVTDAAHESLRRLRQANLESLGEAVDFSPSMRAKVMEAKKFLTESLYRHPRVLRTMSRCDLIVRRLFLHYAENPRQLPFSFQKRIDEDGLYRTAADYIAGMTDRYAEKDFCELFGC